METEKKKRRTPTERQIEELVKLDGEKLVGTAIEAMHALNRRAKEIRDRRNEYRRATFAKHLGDDLDMIYALKDRFLDALVLSGGATVGSFEIRREIRRYECPGCGRSWVGDNYCYQCDDDSGVPDEEVETWFVIDCGKGLRFHQPDVSPAVAAKAVPVPAHDPKQPRREIPKVTLAETRLTIRAQHRCVEIATELLRASLGASGRTPEAPLSTDAGPQLVTSAESTA